MRPSIFAERQAEWSAGMPAQAAHSVSRPRKPASISQIWQSVSDSVQEYLRRDRAYRELTLLDDRLLADIGLNRNEISQAVLGQAKLRG